MLTAPRQSLDGRALLRDWAPVLVLVAAIGVLMLIVSADQDLSPAALKQLSGVEWGLYPVGGLDFVFDYIDLSPFDTSLVHRSWWMTLSLQSVYIVSVAAIGMPIARAALKTERWPVAIVALAGFLPGFVIVLAPLGLLFSAVRYQSASWIALTAIPLVAVMLNRHALVTWGRTRMPRPSLRGVASLVVGVAGLLSLTFVHRLQAEQFFLSQDSIQYVLLAGQRQLQGLIGPYLGHWGVQSDEWIFNAPLMFSSRNEGDLWFPIYATQSVSLASFMVLLAGIVLRLARRRRGIAAVGACVAVFGVTLSPYPWLYVTTIIGGQPVLEVGHPGRQVAMLAPFVVFLLLGEIDRRLLASVVLGSLGLAYITVNALIWVGVVLGAVFIWERLRGTGGEGRRRSAVSWAPRIAPGGALALVVAAFWRPIGTVSPWWGAGLLLGALVIAMVGAACSAASAERAPGSRRSAVRLPWLAAWVLLVGVGLVLSGNMTIDLFDGGLRRALATVMPGYDGLVFTRPDVSGSLIAGLKFPYISLGACPGMLPCAGLRAFLAGVGIPIVLVLSTSVALGRLTGLTETNARYAALCLLVGGIAGGWLLVLYTAADPAQAITLTRLLEIPYYGVVVLAIMAFAELRSRWASAAGLAIIAAWVVVPLVAVHWPEQIVRNAEWYLGQFGM